MIALNRKVYIKYLTVRYTKVVCNLIIMCNQDNQCESVVQTKKGRGMFPTCRITSCPLCSYFFSASCFFGLRSKRSKMSTEAATKRPKVTSRLIMLVVVNHAIAAMRSK